MKKIILILMLFTGICFAQGDTNVTSKIPLDNFEHAVLQKDNEELKKIEKLSTNSYNILTDGKDTNYIQATFRVTSYGIEFAKEIGELLGGVNFINVDGITLEELDKIRKRIMAYQILNTK